MKKNPDPGQGNQDFFDIAETVPNFIANPAQFTGTSNHRHQRALHALMRRSITREQLDRHAGCSNGPSLIAELRARNLDVPCTRIPVYDRDGRKVYAGVYSLSAQDRRKLARWLSSNTGGNHA